MQAVIDNKKHLEELGPLLEDMRDYLAKLEQGCQDLPIGLHAEDKSKPLEVLAQIVEGVSYYQKLLKSAAVLLEIDFSEVLCKNISIASLFDQLCEIFTSIFEAAESQDYSLLTDLIEYDLVPAISISQQIVAVVQIRHKERIV
ncbi:MULTISPECIES: hypothetical protein [Pelosinus]|uniref:Uncharacterized protein n=1 Tax=Pelosinus fermentans B4 TaxID=1149862 RepID=I9B714_9FIRM|nr:MULTISPECIES: hypothetical protein [Pelosinus]EIW20917.1 hypothetical protein FB4_1769 [Pelosinus fermentans B4]EIW27216.1 hypothetical protein FA11_1235 [Pelosinus fermentans A11]